MANKGQILGFVHNAEMFMEFFKAEAKAGNKNAKSAYDTYKAYADRMKKILAEEKMAEDKGEKRAMTGEDSLDLILANRDLYANNDLLDESKGWKSSTASRKALYKFTRTLIDSDHKKLRYFEELNKRGFKKESIKFSELVNEPAPVITYCSKDVVKYHIETLANRLNELDKNAHVNSPSFRKMKSALNDINNLLKKSDPDDFAIGEKMEALQTASMDYIRAKGLGQKKTQLGQDRMDLAVDICAASADFMDAYCSKDRGEAVFYNCLDKTGEPLASSSGFLRVASSNVEQKKAEFDKYWEETRQEREMRMYPEDEDEMDDMEF